MDDFFRVDMNGNLFEFPSLLLDDREISKIVHEINDVFYAKYYDKKFGMHRSLDLQNNYCIYYFENHGFNDYNIVEKIYD